MLLFATGNRHKFEEVSAVLAKYGVELEQKKLDFQELSSSSQKKIVLDKAKQAFAKFKRPLIAEDTGIYFEAYKGFPGTMPKRAFESLGYEGLLALLKGRERNACFLCTICFFDGEKHHFFEGKLEGKIASKVIKPSANVMPYERIFIPKGSKNALVEMSRHEKNSISHRGKAARALGEWFKEKALHDLVDSI